jgi:hypothetical protein
MKEKVLDKAVHSVILDHPSCQTYLDNERHELMKAIDFKLNFQVAPNRKPKKEEGLEDSDDAPLTMSQVANLPVNRRVSMLITDIPRRMKKSAQDNRVQVILVINKEGSCMDEGAARLVELDRRER